MDTQRAVFENDDLRRYIMSFLRKTPQKICRVCQDVLVWDRQVKFHIQTYRDKDSQALCTECFHKTYNGPGCTVS